MQTETKYVRWELHQQSENGRWYRVGSSRKDNYQEAKAELLTTYHKLHQDSPALEWMIGDLAKPPKGKLRIAKCTVEILGEVQP